ncbi:hypothetical protein [Candidatus Uabimicrobium sp. HlEnr_7]|uniref:hypothetical protein n=1 Tax=Candidatus Uabimicrobium helgolandensis TaxID=3095367 RepID=UPI0035560A60
MNEQFYSVIRIIWIVLPAIALLATLQWPSGRNKSLMILFLAGNIATQIGYRIAASIDLNIYPALSIFSILLYLLFISVLFDLGFVLSEKNKDNGF